MLLPRRQAVSPSLLYFSLLAQVLCCFVCLLVALQLRNQVNKFSPFEHVPLQLEDINTNLANTQNLQKLQRDFLEEIFEHLKDWLASLSAGASTVNSIPENPFGKARQGASEELVHAGSVENILVQDDEYHFLRLARYRYGYVLYPPQHTPVGKSLGLYGEFNEAGVDIFRCFVSKGKFPHRSNPLNMKYR